MAWIETDSLSFTARHDDADTGGAQRILDQLEDLRLRLEERFPEAPGDVTVVIHDNPAWLSAAHPLLPAVRWSAAPAARRYVAGWPMAGEIHLLNDEWMERRAGGEDSLRALRGTAARMYCQLVLAANNEQLPPMWTPRRFLAYLRWSWLIEGAAQYFSSQVSLFRPAVITRLREGERPKFPPARRDAIILGGTIFDLLDRHAGPEACVLLASRLRRDGARSNLEMAFDATMREIESAWRASLDDILYPTDLDGGPPSLSDTGETSPLRRRREREEPVDLHDLDLDSGTITASRGPDHPEEPSWLDDSPFDPDRETRRQVRRERGPRDDEPDPGPPPDLDLGAPPEFGFEGSGGSLVEDPDEGEGEEDGGSEPRR
jgi:hypothetical protein